MLSLLANNFAQINTSIFEIPDVRISVLIIIFLLFLGWTISLNQKILQIRNPLNNPWKENVLLLIITTFFSYYFMTSFSTFGKESHWFISFGILFIVFFLFFTQIVEFLTFYNIKDLFTIKKHVSVTIEKQIKNPSQKRTRSDYSLILIIGYLFILLFVNIKKESDYKHTLTSSLFIEQVTPKKTTYAYKVAVQGYNFGDTPGEKFKLFSTYGPVTVDEWTNSKITFTVPLDWKEGSVLLWIERPNRHDNKRIETSNDIEFELLDRWNFFPREHDSKQTRIYKRILKFFYLDHFNNLSSIF